MMIKFNLSISVEKVQICRQDSVFVIGESESLGASNVKKAIEMKFKYNDDTWSLNSATSNSSLCPSDEQDEPRILEFEAFVNIQDISEISEDECIKYKYFIAQKTSQKDKLFLKQVENSWRTLVVDTNSIVLINDKWPYYENDGQKPGRIDQGWLLSGENEIQLHFYDNPLQLWNVAEKDMKQYAIEIKPMKAANGLIELKDYTISHLDFNESKYVVGKTGTFSALNDPSVYSSFRFRSYETLTNVVLQINIYEFNEMSEKKMKHENLIGISYYKVNKSLMESCLIDIDLSLLNGQEVIGSLKAEICMISCTNSLSQMSQKNYQIASNFRYDYSRSCLSIGHRGMGKTFDSTDLAETIFIENTIESFNQAYKNGAEMVEFDIVLTKDKIPIVYHDFSFCIGNKEADADEMRLNKYIDIAVNQLTYDEIKQSRIYSHCVRKMSNANTCTSKLMFPTLREMCNELDTNLGFNVEIKYPQDIEDPTTMNEVGRNIKWLNRNEYANVILKELYEWITDERCVILSTFDPLLCSMLRSKQNKFPILFLTTGITEKWVPYKDFRCKNTKISINFAKSEGLHGIVAHTEELSYNKNLIEDLFIGSDPRSTNFLRIAWGEELNSSVHRITYKKTGLNGIIYDRVQTLDKLEGISITTFTEQDNQECVQG